MSDLSRMFIVVAFTIVVMSTASAQQGSTPAQKFDIGKVEYDGHCATCHGLTGEGHGPVAKSLNKAVPNLKFLQKHIGGVFPFARTYQIIDGTQATLTHGPREMPIWGRRYRVEVGESTYDDYRSDPEAFVRARILALTEYIYRLQAK